MQERHSDRSKYFQEQNYTTTKYVIPFIQSSHSITSNSRILEIGCGEGGNLKPFLDLGCEVVGIDISDNKIQNGLKLFTQDPNASRITLLAQDIYKVSPEEVGVFDVIIMRDTIEHIPNQEKLMGYLKAFLKPQGVMFVAFPPWYNPFGGHQQVCKSKVLSTLPYFHILPKPLYKWILKAGGETEDTITGLMEIVDTQITIERFKRIAKKNQYNIIKEISYLFNPNYEIKFKLKPRVVWSVFAIPFIQNFYTTCGYYLLKNA